MTSLFTLYWIRSAHHTDVLTDGYVGITKRDPHIRHLEHKGRSTVPNDSILEILKSNLAKREAQDQEEFLRPVDNIGWNKTKGGSRPTLDCAKRGAKAIKDRSISSKTGGCSQRVYCSCGLFTTKATLASHLRKHPTHTRQT